MKKQNSNYEEKPRIGAYVDKDIYSLVKAKAAMEGKTISDITEELFRAYVSDIVDTAKTASDVKANRITGNTQDLTLADGSLAIKQE